MRAGTSHVPSCRHVSWVILFTRCQITGSLTAVCKLRYGNEATHESAADTDLAGVSHISKQEGGAKLKLDRWI